MTAKLIRRHIVAAAALRHSQPHAEQLRQPHGREELILRSVRHDATFWIMTTIDFGDDIANMMGDQQHAPAGAGELAQRLAKFTHGTRIEIVGRLVEDERFRAMGQRAAD